MTYIASDIFDNIATCNFTIEVVDDLPPQVVKCLNQTQLLDRKCANPWVRKSPGCKLVWDKPIFTDNSNRSPIVTNSQPTELGKSSIYQVIYTAKDFSKNVNTCIVNITVKYKSCSFLNAPENSNISCSKLNTLTVCNVICHAGFAILNANTGTTKHNLTLQCDHKNPTWPYQGMPVCAQMTIPIITDIISSDINAEGIGCRNGLNDNVSEKCVNMYTSIIKT